MTSGDSEQCLKSKFQMLKQEQIKHRPLKIEVGSGAMAELAFSSDRSHPPFAFCCNQEKCSIQSDFLFKRDCNVISPWHIRFSVIVLSGRLDL